MAHSLLDQAQSSTVEAYRAYKVGDEPNGLSSLFVEFKSGSIYRYIVPWGVYLDMKQAPSLGKFVNQIKVRYVGSMISDQELTNLIQPVTRKSSRKKTLTSALIKLYPELCYFF